MAVDAKYANECKAAVRIGGSEPGEDAPECIAHAVTMAGREGGTHDAAVREGKLLIVYRNEFGPTCAVDDVFERMTVAGWKKVCVLALRQLLRDARAYDLAVRVRPKAWPTIELKPERDSPIISEVALSMPIPRRAALVLDPSGRRR